MPHLIIEYTDNLSAEEIEIKELLKKINFTLLQHKDTIPVAGLRSRAIKLTDYFVADGSNNDAFVHVTLKIGKGRTEEEKAILGDSLFALLKDYFKAVYEKRYFALSLELYEFPTATYKWNNIHNRYKNH